MPWHKWYFLSYDTRDKSDKRKKKSINHRLFRLKTFVLHRVPSKKWNNNKHKRMGENSLKNTSQTLTDQQQGK